MPAPVCIHFQRGFCSRGTDCKFSHDLANGVLPQGDWICQGCGDTQFARNSQCRQCGSPKPAQPGSGTTAVLNLDAVVPAQPEEVEQFLILNPVEEKAAVQFRTMDPRAQRICINKGTLMGARDSTAAFIGRMSQVRRLVESGVTGAAAMQMSGCGGGNQQWQCPACGSANFAQNQQCMQCGCVKPMGAGGCAGNTPNLDQVNPATPEEVEHFLMQHPVEGKVQDQFRNMDPRAQRLVLNRGTLEGSRDPTAAFIGRIVKIDQLVKSQYAQNDWICPACGDIQFGRNLQCRKCNNPKPAVTPHVGGGNNAAGGGMMMMQQQQQMAGCGIVDMSAGAGCSALMQQQGVDMQSMLAMQQQQMGGPGGCGMAQPGVDMSGGAYGAMRGGMAQQPRANPYGQPSVTPNLDQVQPATPVEVEEFLILNPVEQKAADQFRNMDPRGQRLILNRGSLEGARDPTAAFIGRLVKIQHLISGGMPAGDWLCPACGDQQFGRNAQCRKCGTPKPAAVTQVQANPMAMTATMPAGFSSGFS